MSLATNGSSASVRSDVRITARIVRTSDGTRRIYEANGQQFGSLAALKAAFGGV